MNKILLLGGTLLAATASVWAGNSYNGYTPDWADTIVSRPVSEIAFKDGRLFLTDDESGCAFSASKNKKASASPVASTPSRIPHKAVYNDSAAMLRVSKEGDDWFLEVPDSILGRPILAVTRFTATPAGAGVYGGEELRHTTVFFEKSTDRERLFLKNRVRSYVADSLDNVYQAVRAQNDAPLIAVFKIESRTGGKSKIKVTSLFTTESLFTLSDANKRELSASGINPQLSYIESIHSYPINTEVRTVRTYNVTSLSVPTITFGLNTSFLLLPKEPMQPRYYDPRVGFFYDGYYVVSDNQQQVWRDYPVTRRRLEPKDSADAQRQLRGELIEPKKQIVYYIDPATPKQWRPYLIQGVKDWNAAFEQAGWKNAITAKEWPENDSTMSMEDARYSVIMYLASDIANAYGPQNHDPRSGEILESHVGWYHNVMTLVHDWYQVQCGAVDPEARHAKFSTELMGELIRFVSSHEIGHTLGLRHNFGSSSTVPVDSLRSNAFLTKYGHTPSIMDYARFNYVAQPEDDIEIKNLFPRINDYDKWAIEWGYKPMPQAAGADDERYLLIAETTKRLEANHRLWWGNGETLIPDPRCQTEDLSDDAERAGELGIANLQRIIPHLQEWNYWGSDVQDEHLKNMYSAVLDQYLRYCVHVANNLSGIFVTQLASDQPGKMYERPSKERTAKVVPWIKRYMIDEPAWLVDVPYAGRVYTDRERQLEAVAGRIINQITMGGYISSVNPNYGPSQYVDDLNEAIFGRLDTTAPLTEWQRFVQNTYISNLCASYTASKSGVGGDALAAIMSTLMDLDGRLKNVSNSDPATQSHYESLYKKIHDALNNTHAATATR